MTDIVERLRAAGHNALMDEAADEIERLRAALKKSMVAIDDWLHLYASDHCDAKRVEEAEARIGEYGTLWYIATVQKQNCEALSPLPPSERTAVDIADSDQSFQKPDFAGKIGS